MARLVVKKGADNGRVFSVDSDLIKIGRHPHNTITLTDQTVSRHHAEIRRGPDAFYVRDLDSRGGTFVNGQDVHQEVAIKNGDIIRIGATELQFLQEGIVEKTPQAVAAVASALKTMPTAPEKEGMAAFDQKTIAFSVPSVMSLKEEGLSKQRMAVLSKVAEAIQSATELEALLRTLMDGVFDVFHPDRGVILLSEGSDGEFVPRVTRPESDKFVFSRTIVNQAVQQRMALLVTDTATDERFQAAQSIQALAIQAAICCPLVCKEKVLGALYLDTQVNLFTYQQEDLVLLNLIAANAAIAIENAILIREKLESEILSEALEPLVAHSAAMKRIREQMPALTVEKKPILISGDPGTGKYFVAKTIHHSASGRDAPFVTLDCAAYTSDEAYKVLFGSGQVHDFTKPATGPPVTSFAARGALQRAHKGTLVLRHIGALDSISQKVLSQYLDAQATNGDIFPQVRLILTTSVDLKPLVQSGTFLSTLADQVSVHVVNMPRLLNRKEDILPLAELFLSRFSQQSQRYEQRLSKSAENALSSLRFKERNVAELRDAVEFAAFMADGMEIGAEHIFTGPKAQGDPVEYDLTQIGSVGWFVRSRVPQILQGLVVVLFMAIAVVCLVARNSTAGRIANGLVWGLWWPALMILFLFIGRVWCLVCPIAGVGKIIGKIWTLNRPPPKWMKERTGWIVAFLFLGIVWSESVFHMPQTPLATAILLLTLMAFPVVMVLIHQREVWCRYLCPLGGLAAGYSVSSLLQVHSNQKICSTQCKTHECFKGSEADPPCPMFHHPLFVRDAQFCKLCFTCLRSCPHQSPRLYLRPLLRDIWRVGDLSATLVPFALVAFVLSLILLASHRGIWTTDSFGGFTAVSTGAFVVALGLGAGLPKFLSREGDPTLASRVAFALLILAWGPFMAFHLENIPEISNVRISAREGSALAQLFPTAELTLLIVLQYATVFIAALLAAVAFWRIRVHAGKQQDTELLPWGWATLLVICLVYVITATLLVSPGKVPL